MSDPFTRYFDAQTLNNLATKGELTEAHLRAAWQQDRESRNIHVDRIPQEWVPFGLLSSFEHSTVGYVVEDAMKKFNIRLRIRLPDVMAWIVSHVELFEKVSMDHAAFLREILADERFGERVLYQFAESPWAFGTLPEDERFDLLERSLRQFGHVLTWCGLAHCADQWSATRTRSVIHKVIENPEVAGGFLANTESHIGAWWAFETI
ncbi:MAG: hypothetical protein AAB337_02845, partial [Patescibacteria group bacterium]